MYNPNYVVVVIHYYIQKQRYTLGRGLVMVQQMRMRNRIYGKTEPQREGDCIDYETAWYLLRLSGGEFFPDGHAVPYKNHSGLKPIWVKLGEGTSWAQAISFGSSREETERAAEDFGATKVVWMDKKHKTASRVSSLKSKSKKKTGGGKRPPEVVEKIRQANLAMWRQIRGEE
jgi:hypothetical protein